MKLKAIILTIFFIINLNFLKAQFSGPYAPANWGTVAVNSDGITNSGSAPTSIYMVSGDNQSGLPGTNDYTITVPQTGLLSFNWAYTTIDGPNYDYPQFGVNGTISTVNGFNLGGSTTQSGSQPCISVTAGDIFRFRMYTVDNVVGPGTTVFSNFVFTTGNLTVTPATPSVCPGGTLALTASGGSNYSWSGGISNGITFTPTASGVYTVSSGTGLCIVTKTVFVTYNPPLVILGAPSNICANSTATLTGSGGTTYSWSTGAIGPNIVVTPSVNTTFTVFGTSMAGCNTQGVKTVTVDFSPTVTAVSSNTTNGSCPNSPLTLSGIGAATYTWTGGITNAVAFTPTTSNSYTVTGANSCGNATAAISVSIHPLPLIIGGANNPTLCSGNSVVLNGGGGVSYTWTPSVGNNVPFFPQATQNYTVKGTSVLGCTAQAVQGVTVVSSPSITPIVTPTAVCLGGSAVLSAGGATGYTWTPGTGLNASTATVSPQLPTTYTLFRTNGACSNTSTVTLIVNPLPLVVATASPSQICAGDGSDILIVGPITNTTFPPGFTSSSFTVYPNSSITYTVVGSSGSCTASVILPVIVNPRPSVSITSSTNTICEGQSINLTANGTSNLTFTWTPSGNVNNSTEIATPATTTIITLSATNASNCIGSASQLILVNPVPNMSLVSTPSFVCANQQAVISVVNPSTMVAYNWSTNATGPSIQPTPSITTTYVATGINTITLCQNSNTITLAVYIATFAVTSPTALCKGSTGTLTANGLATTYDWTTGSGAPITAPSITVSPVITTVYYVTGTNGSCTFTQSVNVIVNPIPNVTASAAKNQICRYEVSTIAGNGATSYSWNTGATTHTISFTNTLTTTYTVTGTDANFCSKTVTVTQFVATCLGADELSANGSPAVSVYPNPNNGNFMISSDVDLTVSIVNTLGQVVQRMSLNKNDNNKVTVSSLPTGIYFITGESQGLKVNKKIIIER